MVKIGKLLFDKESRNLTLPNKTLLHLTPSESKLFTILAENKGGYIKKEIILRGIKSKSKNLKRVIDVYVFRFRKLFALDPSITFKTVNRGGYILTEDGTERLPIKKV